MNRRQANAKKEVGALLSRLASILSAHEFQQLTGRVPFDVKLRYDSYRDWLKTEYQKLVCGQVEK